MADISKLIEILKEEEIIYREILDLANKKTEMIAEESIAEIESIAKQEEEHLKQAKLIEYKREDQIILIEKSLKIEEMSDISSLSKHVEDETLKKQLLETQNKFSQTLNELKRINIVNNTLIQDALEYITLSLNIMTEATAEGTYGKNATEAQVQGQNKNVFDFKG